MRKILILLIVLFGVLGLTACSTQSYATQQKILRDCEVGDVLEVTGYKKSPPYSTDSDYVYGTYTAHIITLSNDLPSENSDGSISYYYYLIIFIEDSWAVEKSIHDYFNGGFKISKQ